MSFLQRQIREIQCDDSLRLYGGALALVNGLTAIFWLVGDAKLSRILDPSVPAVCWPFWENCYQARVASQQSVTMAVVVVLIASVLNAAMFSRKGLVPTAYWTLIAVSVLKYGLVVQDFRLTLNHHYMALWVGTVFILVPGKRSALQFLLVSFYLWAGILKLSPDADWLSGAALYGRRPLGLPSEIIPIACAYVIALELLVSFALLAKREWVFALAFGQFLLFHFASFWVVGFFYPVLMFLLLSVFPLTRYLEPGVPIKPPASGSLLSIAASLPKASSLVVVVAFSVCQILPRAFPGDSAITGQGRLFALNMFDAPTDCRATVLTGRQDGPRQAIPLRAPYLHPRIWCDPIVYLSLANNRCRAIRALRSLEEFTLILETRRSQQSTFERIVEIDHFCESKTEYSLLRHNAWIRSR